ncbi:hypothetical protein COOONC_16649 [Cooperia oncophora]
MITTQASLDELNTKLENSGSMEMFLGFEQKLSSSDCSRSVPAWDEDKWIDLQIGDTRLQCFKPCTRCVLTTVDPLTGTKDSDMQPLKKLRQFTSTTEGPMRQQLRTSYSSALQHRARKRCCRHKPVVYSYFSFYKNLPSYDLSGYDHVRQTGYARLTKVPFELHHPLPFNHLHLIIILMKISTICQLVILSLVLRKLQFFCSEKDS